MFHLRTDEAEGWSDNDDNNLDYSSFPTPPKTSLETKANRNDDLLINWNESQVSKASSLSSSEWASEHNRRWGGENTFNAASSTASKLHPVKASSLSPLASMKASERKVTRSGPSSERKAEVSSGAWERAKPKPIEGDFFEELLGSGSKSSLKSSKASSIASGHRSPTGRQLATKASITRKPVELEKKKDEEDEWDAW